MNLSELKNLKGQYLSELGGLYVEKIMIEDRLKEISKLMNELVNDIGTVELLMNNTTNVHEELKEAIKEE